MAMSWSIALTTIAETGSLRCAGPQRAAKLVHHQGCQGLTLHIFRDDEQWLADLGNLLQQWKQVGCTT